MKNKQEHVEVVAVEELSNVTGGMRMSYGGACVMGAIVGGAIANGPGAAAGCAAGLALRAIDGPS